MLELLSCTRKVRPLLSLRLKHCRVRVTQESRPAAIIARLAARWLHLILRSPFCEPRWTRTVKAATRCQTKYSTYTAYGVRCGNEYYRPIRYPTNRWNTTVEDRAPSLHLPGIYLKQNKKQVVDWLTDLSWVPNGAVVLISCVGPGGPKKGKPPAGASSDSNRGSPAVSASVGGHGVVAPGQEGTVDAGAEKEAGENDEDDEEEEEETLALAALSRIRESYKTRARGRQSEAAKGSGGAAEEEAGQRMIEKRRAAEKTASFRQVRLRGSRVLCLRRAALMRFSSVFMHLVR